LASYEQKGGCLMQSVCLATMLSKLSKGDTQFTFCRELRQIFTDFEKGFIGTLSNKPFLIRLLKIPPHIKYVTTVPSYLSLITALVCDCLVHL